MARKRPSTGKTTRWLLTLEELGASGSTFLGEQTVALSQATFVVELSTAQGIFNVLWTTTSIGATSDVYACSYDYDLKKEGPASEELCATLALLD